MISMLMQRTGAEPILCLHFNTIAYVSFKNTNADVDAKSERALKYSVLTHSENLQ